MIDAVIAALAGRQHGNVTRWQLLELGLTDGAIAHRVATGRLHRVYPGVYAVGRPPKTPLERAAAAVLACGPGAALSHEAAGALWGFLKHWPTTFDVTVRLDRRPRGVRVHRCATLTRRDIRTPLGIRATSPARTLLDCAPRLDDRTRTRAVNDARLSTYLQPGDLPELLARCPTHPGAKLLKPFTTTRRNPTRSEFEDAFLDFFERFNLPEPRVNTKVAGFEVDAFFEAEKLIVELDGYEFHSDKGAFRRDRDRDADALVARLETVRITWDGLMDTPHKEAARLHAILQARRAEAA